MKRASLFQEIKILFSILCITKKKIIILKSVEFPATFQINFKLPFIPC